MGIRIREVVDDVGGRIMLQNTFLGDTGASHACQAGELSALYLTLCKVLLQNPHNTLHLSASTSGFEWFGYDKDHILSNLPCALASASAFLSTQRFELQQDATGAVNFDLCLPISTFVRLDQPYTRVLFSIIHKCVNL